MSNSGSLASKGAAVKRDWTQGSIVGNLWSLSRPILISTATNILGPTVDMIWVGRLGSNAIAAVGVSGMAIQVANALVQGIFTGTTAMIARHIGAKDEKTANRIAQQSFVIGAVFSILMAVIGIFLSETILALMGVDSAVIAKGAAYLRIQFVGIVTMSALQISQSIMQASGDAVNPLKISIGMRVFQIALCPALVFGWGLFPDLGVSGASLSNVIAQGLAAGVAMWVLFSGRTRIVVSFKNFRLDPGLIWRTIKIGLPATTTFVLISFTEMMVMRFITPFGTVAVAAQTLAQRIDMLIQSLSAGIGIAAGVLCAQNLGAGQPARATRTGWLAVAMATGITLVCSIIIWFRVDAILQIFHPTSDVSEMAANFLKIQIVTYVVWGLVITFTLTLNGIGDTMIPLLTNLLTMLGIQLALAWLLPQVTPLGVYGVRWGIVAGQVLRAVIYTTYFKSGRWQRKKV